MATRRSNARAILLLTRYDAKPSDFTPTPGIAHVARPEVFFNASHYCPLVCDVRLVTQQFLDACKDLGFEVFSFQYVLRCLLWPTWGTRFWLFVEQQQLRAHFQCWGTRKRLP